LKNLIAFLNDISKESPELKPTKQIHEDYTRFSTNLTEVEAKVAQLEELTKKRNVAELKQFDESYKAYREVLPQLEYLKTITEAIVCRAYHAALLHDSEKYFTASMSDNNKEQFYRLKFRALNLARTFDAENYYKILPDILEFQI